MLDNGQRVELFFLSFFLAVFLSFCRKTIHALRARVQGSSHGYQLMYLVTMLNSFALKFGSAQVVLG